MPIVKPPISRNVTVQWFGSEVVDRVRRGTRAAMDELGKQGVAVAQQHVHIDTGNLHDNIEARVPRSVRGSARYIVLIGVFPDGENASKYGNQQPAWQYAFWQETLPEPIGRAFLRPALDHVMAHWEEVFRAKVRFKRGERFGRLPAGSSAHTFSGSDTNISEGEDDE